MWKIGICTLTLCALVACTDKAAPEVVDRNYDLEPAHQETLEEMAQRRVAEQARQKELEIAAQAENLSEYGWISSEQTDEFTGKTTRYTGIKSVNKAYFDFPYGGGSTGTITFRKTKGSREEAYFSVDKGQIVCASDGCEIQIKVEDQSSQSFRMSRTTDYSSTVLFFDSPSRLRKLISGMQPFKLRATFYKFGYATYEFIPPNQLR